MGTCRHCGEDAGWFKREHKACVEGKRRAQREIVNLCVAGALSGEHDPGFSGRLRDIAERGRLSDSGLRALVIEGMDRALQSALDDHILEPSELRALHMFQASQRIGDHELEARGFNEKVRQSALLRTLFEDGAIPKAERPRLGSSRERLPFNTMKSETVLWVFKDVEYLTEVTRREFQAGSSGMSFRVAKGVYYRTGNSRGRTVTSKSMEVVDSGIMGITTKHIYWAGQQGFGNSKSFRIRLNRIVSLEDYSDGIGIMRDTQRAKPEGFSGIDGGFATNLIEIAAYKLDEDGFTNADQTLDEMVAPDEDIVGMAFAAGEVAGAGTH